MAARASVEQNEGDQTPVIAALVEALRKEALPGEIAGLDDAALTAIALLLCKAASSRRPGEPAILVQPHRDAAGIRRTRIAIANDDMPFLVDSAAAAVTAEGLTIERLLHPVVERVREGNDRLTIDPTCQGGGPRESLIFLEAEHANARTRARLTASITAALADTRRAVSDWKAMVACLEADADQMDAAEPAAFLRWLADHHFTLLGVIETDPDHRPLGRGLGIFADGDPSLWSDDSADAVARVLASRDMPLLIVNADRVGTVHRRGVLDYVGVPRRAEDGSLSAITHYVGFYTSQALSAPLETVPLIRERVAALMARLAFAPRSHAAKALTHAIASLPRDLLFTLNDEQLRLVATTAMSLIDRPRSKLLIVPDPLGRYSTVLVWLPRDIFSAEQRIAIGHMLEQGLGGTLERWSAELRDEALVSIRYVVAHVADGDRVSADLLDQRLSDMVRGWLPAVEAVLRETLPPTSALRAALTYAAAFGASYRIRFSPAEAAADILRLMQLKTPEKMDVRLASAADGRLRLRLYRLEQVIALSDSVPILENFGFRVIEELSFDLADGRLGWIHEFTIEPASPVDLADDGAMLETALRAVFNGHDENDGFNGLIASAGLDRRSVLWLRAWFRYLRQTGISYGFGTVVAALSAAVPVTRGLIALFIARHDPQPGSEAAEQAEAEARTAIADGLAAVTSIDDDHILRLVLSLVEACVRTNAFVPEGPEALAFKFDAAAIPGLPKPVPWREIFVYSPRVEGVHLRGGPVARGGLRWSDRRDDFRTEILGLLKAQIVKNAVIVPTGAKGGFYPKQLPSPSDRDAWLAEGTEAYRIYIRALLSLTDNIIDGKVVPPAHVRRHDDDDPYLVVAADKGTAAFSDVANAIAGEQGFWLGDAFASGGSHGYDHKAMGITARGAWVSVTRHFAEMDVDIQSDAITVAGVGDMSGDVFGNGMLLSRGLRLVAAFDHRHIFLDPDPDPEQAWCERKRLFELPRSSWDDYDKALISAGGGVFPRSQKSIPLSPQVRAVLGVETEALGPSELIAAILKSPVDLLWFGGIGTYVKAADETNAEVGDRANDLHRVNGDQLRAKVVGEGANLAITQAGRIAYAAHGGHINTDFIDNSAGVDCSDQEVNIKIALGPPVASGDLSVEDRNALLADMTDAVAHLVLEDNRLQTQALSIAERGGAAAVPGHARAMQIFEAAERLDRAVEGLPSDDELAQRVQSGRGLERPELAVLLAYAKIAMQDAIEASSLADDPLLEADLLSAFPEAMVEQHRDAILSHRLRGPLIATKLANRIVNRLGITRPTAIAEEEGTSLAHVATAYAALSAIFDLPGLWRAIEKEAVPEQIRLQLLERAAGAVRLHVADLVQAIAPDVMPSTIVERLKQGVDRLSGALDELLRSESHRHIGRLRNELADLGAGEALVEAITHLYALDGAIGVAALAERLAVPEPALAHAYVRLGEALGLDWAKAASVTLQPADSWERLLLAGIARDLEQLRLDLLRRIVAEDDRPQDAAERWLGSQRPRADQLRALVNRARSSGSITPVMLAQLASQARAVLSR